MELKLCGLQGVLPDVFGKPAWLYTAPLDLVYRQGSIHCWS